jgi:superoxide reductase
MCFRELISTHNVIYPNARIDLTQVDRVGDRHLSGTINTNNGEFPMNRRHFLIGSAAATAVATMSGTTLAEAGSASLPPKNLIFTKENAGKWEAKKGSHVPKIEVAGAKIKISTKHAQSEDHYIVRHTLLLADGTVVGSTTFTPENKPISEYELPANYKGNIYATSFCNRHDLWLNEATI